jgi:hypothetical protein
MRSMNICGAEEGKKFDFTNVCSAEEGGLSDGGSWGALLKAACGNDVTFRVGALVASG